MSAAAPDHAVLASRIAALEHSLERVADGYLAFDAQMTCVYANQGGARLLGLSPEAITGMPLWAAVPDAAGLPVGRVCLEALRMQQPASLEAYSEPQQRWFSYRAYPDAGGVSVCIHGIARFSDTETALKQSEQRLRTLLERLPEGILVTDRQSRRFVFANEAIARMLGYTSEELTSLTLEAIHPAQDLPQVLAGFDRAAADPRHTGRHIPMLRKDGSIFFADVQGVPVELDGRPCLCGVFTDRTAELEQERQLREAKEAAEQRELILLEAQEIAEIGYWELDLVHNRLYWSDQIYSIFGRPPQAFDATYEGFLAFVHPEDRSLVEAAYSRHLREQAPYDLVHRIVTAGQRVRYVRERCKTTFSADGTPLRSLGVVADVTRIREAEQARLESESRYRILFEHSPVGMFAADETQQILFVNQQFTALTGYRLEDMPDSEAIWKRAYPEPGYREALRVRWDAAVREAVRRRAGIEPMEVQVHCKDGSTKWFESGFVYTGQTGIVTIVDISARKQAEEALQDKIRELETARAEVLRVHQQLEMTLDCAVDAVVTIDADKEIVFFNQSAEAMFGFEKDEVLGRPMSILLPEPMRAGHDAYIDMNLQTGQDHVIGHGRDFELTHRDGTRFWGHIALSKIQVDGKPQFTAFIKDITDRRLAEIRLAENEARLDQIATHSRSIAWEVDAEGRYTYISHVVADVLGYRPGEIAGRLHFYDLHPEKERETFREEAFAVFGRKEPFRNLENQAQTKDGRTVWLLTNGMPLLAADGSLLGYRGSDVDITDRKQAENEAYLLRQAIASSTVGIVLADAQQPDMPLVYVNPAFETLTGYTPEESLGRNCRFLQGDDLNQPDIELLRNATLHKQSASAILRNYRKDGTLFWNHLTISPLFDQQGRLTHYLGIQKDITDIKSAEGTLRHYAAALEERSVQLNTLIDTLPDLVWLKNPEGVYLRCNPRFESLMGAAEADIIGKNDFEFFDPEQARFFRAHDQAAIAAGSPQTNEELLTFADGHQELVETTKTPMIDAQGRLIGVLGIAHDITRRKASEEALRRSELQFRTLFDESPVSIIVHDKDTGEIVDANPVAWRSYGCGSLAELQQQHFWLDPPYSFAEALANIRLAARQEHLRFEWKSSRADGTLFWEQVDLRLLTINGTERVLATSIDITARKEAELAMEVFSHDLGERLKEMSCLASLSKLIETPGITASQVLQAAAALLPPAFQFASAASACICFDGHRYESDPYAPSATVLQTELSVGGKFRGSVEVNYDRPLPFLPEEENLLQMVKRSLELFFERETASAALRDSEERLRLAIAAADQGLYDLDLRTGETIVSPEYARMLGYDPEQFRETHAAWLQRLHPDDRPGVEQAYQNYIAGRIPEYRVEFRQQAADGTWIWVLSLGRIQARDTAGHPVRMLGTQTDITARKLAEEALRESEQKYRALFELSPVGMVAIDRHGAPVLANRQFEQLTGYTLQDVPQAEAWWEAAYPEASYRSHVRTRWEAALRQPAESLAASAPMEVLIRQKNGEFRYVEIGFMPTGTLDTATFTDVHERKLAEVALRESEAKYRDLIEHSPVAMAVVDSSLHQMVLVNRKLTELTGYTLEDIPTVERFVRQAYPDGQDQIRQFGLRDRVLHSILSSGEIQGVPPVSARIQCKDGSYRHVEASFVAAGQYVIAALVDLTERTLAEEALRAERDLFSAGPVFTIIWDPADQWPVEYVSGNVAQVLGYSPQDMRSPDFRYASLIHPEDVERISAEVSYNFANGIDVFEQSYRLRLKNGTYRWFYDFTKLIRNGAGEVSKIRGYLFDQTSLKELETALKEERQRLDYIITGTNAGTWEWNVQTGETVYNPRWAQMLGYTLEMLAPLSIDTWKHLTHPEDLERCMGLLAQHFEGKRDYYEAELRMRHRDGRWIWVQDRGKVSVWGKDGKPLLMSGTHLDITLRKQAEEALQESEARYRGLLEEAPVGIAVQQQGRIVYCNPAGLRLMAADSDAELIGKPVSEVIHPEDLPFAVQLQRRLMAGETSIFPVEVRFVRADGSITDVDLTASLITYRQAPAIQIIATDITERKQHLQAIEAQNKILKDIAWTQSHVVRAPLARLMGLVGLLEEHNFSGFSEADMLRYITASANELDQIIRNISEKAYTVGALEYEAGQHKRHQMPQIQPKHIELLIIDDDPLIQKLHRVMAVKNGLHESPQTFSSGQEALDFIRSRNEPDTLHLLLLDINMPGMNGWEVLEALRQEEPACMIAVVMLTSSVDISDRIRAQRYPQVIEYLTKPINKQTVADLKQHPRLRQYWP
ncbi:MAG: PAS domain S-box protein [Bacteroidia bacterium]|nr:PAS domain S-box protein [Bacteroidia bacterium]